MSEQQKQKGIVTYDTPQGEVSLSPATIRRYLVSGQGDVSDQEVTMFLGLCKYQRLNPFLREAYLIKYGQKDPATMVVGKDVFTRRAAAHEKSDGWAAGVIVMTVDGKLERRKGSLTLEGEKIVGGWATVHRKDWSIPIENEVAFDEYAGRKRDGTLNRSWASKPATMIRKVALVQALRDAYPDILSALYDASEVGVDDEAYMRTSPIEGDILQRQSERERQQTEPEQLPPVEEQGHGQEPLDPHRPSVDPRSPPDDSDVPPPSNDEERMRLVRTYVGVQNAQPDLFKSLFGEVESPPAYQMPLSELRRRCDALESMMSRGD